MSSPLTGPVEVVGAGLLGTSIALACRRAGLEVLLSDVAPEHVRTASGLGAGRPRTPEDRPQLVVVAVPPDHLAEVIAEALAPRDAVVTDVGSVKSGPRRGGRAGASPEALTRYVGGHPMAGSERSGPLAASAALFDGRPWAVTPHDDVATPTRSALVEALVALCGAVPVRLQPGGARPGRGPDLPPAAPARRAGGRPARRRARPTISRCPGRASATSPGSPAATRRCRSRSSRANAAAVRRAAGRGARRAGRHDRRRHRRLARRGWAPCCDRGRGRHPRDPRQARRPGPADPVGVRLRARPSRASWPACSPTPARARSTSRTSTSTTTPAVPVGLVELVVEEARAEHLLAVSGISWLGDPQVGCGRPSDRTRPPRNPKAGHVSVTPRTSSSPSTAPPDRASRAPRAASPPGWGCATSTPARSSAR